ncbi:unnamed protein product, partial [Symbiodinium necroappetens]
MKLGSSRAFGSFRALTVLAWVLCWATSRSFKLSGSPIPVTDSANATVQEIVEEVVADDLKQDMEEINNMSNPMTENASDPGEGFGQLAKNLEFLLVKVAQLEAVAEMQQAELISYRKKFDSQQSQIDSLQAQIGHHEPQDGGALLEMEQKDAQTRLQEAQDVVKRVFLKHNRQREKGILHHEEDIATAAESGESQGSSSDRESGFWNHRRRRFPQVIVDSGKAAVDAAKNPIDTLKDGYNAATDKAEWLKNNAISTVEQAVAILSQGFSNFGASCPNSAAPSIRTFNSHELKIYFGDLRCKISLMGQDTPLFGLNFGEHRIGLPSQFKILFHLGWELVDTCRGTHNHIEVTKCLARSLARVTPPLDLLPSQMRILYHIGWELQNTCHTHNHIEVTKCLARSLAKFSPPVDFLPDRLKKVANGQVLDLLPDQLKKVANNQILDLLPDQLKILFHLGWELTGSCKGNHNHVAVTKCLASSLTKVGKLLDFLPDPLQKVANGKVFDLLPDQLRILFHLGWELWHSCKGNHNHVEVTKCLARSLAKFSPPLDFLPDPLKKVASGDIMGLLPGQLNQIASGNIMGLMPGPMQLLGGGQANSIQNMLTLGNALMDCSDSQQSDLVKCLGFKIIASNPPLNFLNRLGDIFAEFVGTFAKVAAA